MKQEKQAKVTSYQFLTQSGQRHGPTGPTPPGCTSTRRFSTVTTLSQSKSSAKLIHKMPKQVMGFSLMTSQKSNTSHPRSNKIDNFTYLLRSSFPSKSCPSSLEHESFANAIKNPSFITCPIPTAQLMRNCKQQVLYKNT